MISCYVLALWVLNMRVKFHSLGLPQSLSLEMEVVHMATNGPNQSERSKICLDQSESRIGR